MKALLTLVEASAEMGEVRHMVRLWTAVVKQGDGDVRGNRRILHRIKADLRAKKLEVRRLTKVVARNEG